MDIYTKIRKLIVGKDLSRGIIASKVREKAFSRLIKNCNPNDKILDVGCGEGLFLRKAAKELPEARITGIDSWERMLNHCRQQIITEDIKNIQLQYAKAENLPFAENTFQHVLFINTLHNQKSFEAAAVILQETLRVAVPGGKIYIDIRNKGNLFFRMAYMFVRRLDSTKPTITMYNKKEIVVALKAICPSDIKFISIDLFRCGYIIEITK